MIQVRDLQCQRLAMSKTARKHLLNQLKKNVPGFYRSTTALISSHITVECNRSSKRARFGSACRPKPDWQGSIVRATPAQGSPNATSTTKQCHHISPGDAVLHHCYQRCDCLTALVTKDQDYLMITSTNVM